MAHSPELRIEIIAVDNLTEYDGNAREHGREDIEAIEWSIGQFGFNDPIGIWSEDNVIVEGHGRLKAAKNLGMTEVPCIRLDHMTDEERRAYAIAHNKTAELSTWDFQKLDLELAGIHEFDMSKLGFLHQELDIEVTNDEYDIDNEEPDTRVQRGQIWQLGAHRLMCGDATDEEDILKLLGDEHINIALTDPPYGINIVRGGHIGTGNWPCGGAAALKFGKVGGGSMSTPISNRIQPDAVVPARTYSAVIGDDTTETAQKHYELISRYSDNQIIFGGNYFTDFLPASRCWLVWDKENTGNFADAELAWTSFDKGVKLYRWMWNGLARKGDRKTEGITRVHPTQKPVGMIGEIIKDFTHEGDIIADCFGGSGTTLIACEQLGRQCFMMEMDPHYCDVIIDRWEKLTGQTAQLISG